MAVAVSPCSISTPARIRTWDRRIRNALLRSGWTSDASQIQQNKGFSNVWFYCGFSHLPKSGYSFLKCTHF